MNRFDEIVHVEVFNMLGERVAKRLAGYGENLIDLSGKKGLFFVTVMNTASSVLTRQKIQVR